MSKRDPYKTKERWESWKKEYFNKTPPGIRKDNWKILVDFLNDMELGVNLGISQSKHLRFKKKKGKREPITLLNLAFHNKLFLEHIKKPLNELKKEELHKLEKDVEDGKILKRNKQKFRSFGNYTKDFKVFWNWGMRTGRFKEDIIEDISTKTNKPVWVYLTDEQVKSFFNRLDFDYRVICWFLYDSGMRVTEANSIQIKDFNEDFTQVTISDEAAKTFGRTINLKLCSQYIKEYIQMHGLQDEDYLIQKQTYAINKYLRYHCLKMFGDKISHPKSKGNYKHFTMYDIRHNAACFWFNKYSTQKGLMYRMGWRDPSKIEYYSEFLGASDELTDSDMIIGEDKNKLILLEQQNKDMQKDIEMLKQITRGINDAIESETLVFNPKLKINKNLDQKKMIKHLAVMEKKH